MSRLEDVGRDHGIYFTAADLMSQTFPEPKWAVEGLIAEGLTLLVGSPKLGKSWMCLGLAVAVATGGRALGKIKVEAGPVLYAALEDTPRRLQGRLVKLLCDDNAPADLHIVTSMPPMPDAIDLLEEWLESHPTARLVVVDVLKKIRPPADRSASAYDHDYMVMSALKGLADRRKVAVVVVHHTRKMADDSDVFNEVSGSTGLTGAADAILIAKKARNTSEATLHVTGRDITESDYALNWEALTCTWTLLEEPVSALSQVGTRRKITEWLTANQSGTPMQIAEGTGLNHATIKQNVRRMVTDDQLDSDGEGTYFLPLERVSPLSPLSPIQMSLGDSSDSSDTSTGGVAA